MKCKQYVHKYECNFSAELFLFSAAPANNLKCESNNEQTNKKKTSKREQKESKQRSCNKVLRINYNRITKEKFV